METLKKYAFLLLCVMTLGLVGCDPDGGSAIGGGGDDEEVLITKITLDPDTLTLKEGAKPVKLTAKISPKDATNKKLGWSSSDEEVVTVDENGLVTAVSEGTATITVKAKDGSNKKAKCGVTVVALQPGEVLVDTIELSSNEMRIELEEEYSEELFYIYATVKESYATNKDLEWTSSNEDVVEIVSVGSYYEGNYDVTLRAVGGGTAVITAMTQDGSGVSASCEVTVIAPEPEYEPVPDDVKKKLEAVGLEFVNTIKAETHQNLVEVIDFLDNTYGYYDIDEAYEKKLESLVQESGDYARGKNPVRAMTRMAKVCLATAQNGAQLSTRAADIYTCALEAGLPDLYGGFTPDSYSEEWVYDAGVNDRIEFSFTDDNDQKWVATLKGGKETTRVHIVSNYDYISNRYHDDVFVGTENSTENYDFAIDVPKQMTFTVKCGSKTIVDMTVNSALAFDMNVDVEEEYDEHYYYDEYYDEYWSNYSDFVSESYFFELDYSNLSVDAKMTVNGYEETFKTNVSRSGVTANAGVKIDGKSMLTASATVNADFNAFFDAVEKQSEPTPDEVADWIKNVSMDFDVLGQVQLKASCPSFYDFYKASEQVTEAYDFNSFSKAVDSYNKAFDIKLYFDKKSSEVAFIDIEAYEDDEWGGTSYYGSPVIVLTSDDSRHNIEDYFDDEASFSDLIDAANRLGEEFEELYSGYSY